MGKFNVTRRALYGVNVLEGEDLTKEVAPTLRETVEEGALFVVYEDRDAAIAKEIMASLRIMYRVFDCAEEAAPPEFVRHVLAVGGGKAIDGARQAASDLDIDFCIYLTAPDTDKILCDKKPKIVFIDKNALLNCGFERLAAGYGLAYAQPLRAFEAMFRKRVLALEGPSDAVQLPVGADVGELANALMTMSRQKDWEDSADIMARILAARAARDGRKVRSHGEYKYLCAAVITAFYGSLLGAPGIDVMPPPDLSAEADALAEIGATRDMNCKKVDFFDINAYFRISYILSEYRMDLLRLAGADFHASQRFWRRIYPDAGYWLKSEFSVKELFCAMKLAGASSDGLLGYAYAMGVLADM